jgi:hypothetical protein
VSFAVGTSPQTIISADFNADGKMDLATDGSNVYVLLGNGLGSFSDFSTFNIAGGAYSIVSGDFNGDSAIDLAAADKTSNNVSVFIGNGLGSFGTAINFTVGTGPESVISADFNGDGNIDLATANYTANNLSVLMGNGLGSFAAATNFSVGTAPTSIVSADFNEDGKMDLATTNANSNNVSVLLNFIPFLTVSVSGATFTADQNEATYQWINCNGNVPISGETDQVFNATASGDYAVVVTQNTCSDTSACYSLTTVGIIENASAAITVYPNPNNGRYTVKGNNITSIEVYNVVGENVFQSMINNQQSDIDLSNNASGIYLMKIYKGQTFIIERVVVQ